jgi:hypothetical protein
MRQRAFPDGPSGQSAGVADDPNLPPSAADGANQCLWIISKWNRMRAMAAGQTHDGQVAIRGPKF